MSENIENKEVAKQHSKKRPLPLPIKIVRSALLIYVGVSLGLFLIQGKLIFVPTEEHRETPSRYNLEYEDVTITSSNGEKIHAWYIPAEKSRGFVLFCHGNGGNIGDRVDIAHFTVEKLHLNTLLFDYQGYGKSTGSPGEKEFYADAQAALEYLKTKGAAPKNTVIFGKSIGCGVAVETALHNECAALVLSSPPSSIADVAKHRFPWLPCEMIVRHKFNSASKMPSIHVPVLVFHSRLDEIVPFELGHKVFEVANEPKYFFELDVGHNSYSQFYDESYIEKWTNFLGKHLLQKSE